MEIDYSKFEDLVNYRRKSQIESEISKINAKYQYSETCLICGEKSKRKLGKNLEHVLTMPKGNGKRNTLRHK